jgi:hypothetical protein
LGEPFAGLLRLKGVRINENKLDKEIKMNFKAKVAIFLLATLITLTGFSLIASSSAIDILKVGKKAGYQIIANVLAEAQQHVDPS